MERMRGMRKFQSNLPGSDVTSAVNCVITHGGDESIVKRTKTVLCYNVILVTSPTQPHGTRDSEMS